MDQSSSLSTKSYNTAGGFLQDQDKNNSHVNWISVINFLENQYAKSSVRQKEWYLEKKLLNQEILKLKNQLTAVEALNYNLNNRIKLLENALRRQKLIKNYQNQLTESTNLQQTRTIQDIENYFQKNGWILSDKPSNMEQNSHKKFLTKVLEEVGIDFNKVQQSCRKMSIVSVDTQKIERKNTGQKFQSLIDELNKVKIQCRIKINAHLDSVRGLFAMKNSQQKNIIVSVSQDCLVKTWSINPKNNYESIEPLSSFREHTGQLFNIDGGILDENNNNIVVFTAGTEEYVKVWYSPEKEKIEYLKCAGWFFNEKQQNTTKSNDLENQIIWNLKYKDKKLLTSASDGAARLFKVQIKDEENRFISEDVHVLQFADIQTAIEWVGDRAFLSSYTNSPRINLWDIERSKIVQKYVYQTEKIKEDKSNPKKQTQNSILFQTNSLKYFSDFKLIYAGCEDKTIRIFSYDQNKMLKILDNGVNDSISCIDIYKSNFIVAGCQDGALKLWDRRTYRLLVDEFGHKPKYDEGILSLRTTQDGIFTSGADGIINFYGI